MRITVETLLRVTSWRVISQGMEYRLNGLWWPLLLMDQRRELCLFQLKVSLSIKEVTINIKNSQAACGSHASPSHLSPGPAVEQFYWWGYREWKGKTESWLEEERRGMTQQSSHSLLSSVSHFKAFHRTILQHFPLVHGMAESSLKIIAMTHHNTICRSASGIMTRKVGPVLTSSWKRVLRKKKYRDFKLLLH